MNTMRVNCPLCEWHYDVPPVNADHNTLAGVFGHGIMFNHALNDQARKTEEQLQLHLGSHTLVEWVRKVTALENENRCLRAEVSMLKSPVSEGTTWPIA